MILPTKHIPLPDTYLGIGGLLLKELSVPRTVPELWKRVRKNNSVSTLERFYLALDMLYTLKLIDLSGSLLHRRIGA